MFHIPNDVRAKKSAALIIQGLEKCFEEKPFDKIKVSDIYNNSFVSRATFYRLFDSIYDVLLYQCECIRNEAIELVPKLKLKSTKDIGIYAFKIWLKHEAFIKAIVKNQLYGVLYEAHMLHKEDFQTLYSVDYKDESQLSYFASFVVSILFCSFTVYLNEKEKKTSEELIEYNNKMVAKVIKAWGIDQYIDKI